MEAWNHVRLIYVDAVEPLLRTRLPIVANHVVDGYKTTKNDDKKILVPSGPSGFYTVKHQETWTQIVNGTIPHNNINMVWGEPIREIWVNNQFYGYVIHYVVDQKIGGPLGVWVVDDNTVWLIWH